ncbi:Retrovirus-related Pol polyprotein LINE-1 [Gossypium australe]|uniref:Retrovirus-related Pol polyprotein LINE-1 n=1 Tax=Gossypium australe TaxID=47621 RepID=A0A5B6WDC6_9ROSI|nr:Retrovirus-related Pol polyprotein LINE-1 [Gossypium australe]
MVIGDFNVILSSNEKIGGLLAGKRCPHFGNFVDLANLHDLGFRGPPFTWHRGNLFERLDHALGNEVWVNYFPNSLTTHLPRIKSDHRPLLFSLNLSFALPRGRPLVRKQWDFQGNMSVSLDKFIGDLKEWNKTIYDHITTRKRNLIHKLSTVQKKMCLLGANHLASVEIEIRHELENVLHHEELLWKQKARCDWLH